MTDGDGVSDVRKAKRKRNLFSFPRWERFRLSLRAECLNVACVDAFKSVADRLSQKWIISQDGNKRKDEMHTPHAQQDAEDSYLCWNARYYLFFKDKVLQYKDFFFNHIPG